MSSAALPDLSTLISTLAVLCDAIRDNTLALRAQTSFAVSQSAILPVTRTRRAEPQSEYGKAHYLSPEEKAAQAQAEFLATSQTASESRDFAKASDRNAARGSKKARRLD